MGVRDYLPVLADGGVGSTDAADGRADEQTHHECRDCGRNLDGDEPACPECGGTVVTYRF
jgi:ribosomal protein L37E